MACPFSNDMWISNVGAGSGVEDGDSCVEAISGRGRQLILQVSWVLVGWTMVTATHNILERNDLLSCRCDM